jgi:putative FmdB family regulatory protein
VVVLIKILLVCDISGKEERMPIYEFKCLQCGHVFELLKLKKENEGLEMKCPKCSSSEVEKILSTMNIARSASGKSTSATKSCSSGSCTSFEIPGPKR